MEKWKYGKTMEKYLTVFLLVMYDIRKKFPLNFFRFLWRIKSLSFSLDNTSQFTGKLFYITLLFSLSLSFTWCPAFAGKLFYITIPLFFFLLDFSCFFFLFFSLFFFKKFFPFLLYLFVPRMWILTNWHWKSKHPLLSHSNALALICLGQCPDRPYFTALATSKLCRRYRISLLSTIGHNVPIETPTGYMSYKAWF